MDSNNTSSSRMILIQDLGILLFMISVISGCLVTVLTGKALLYQNIVLLMALLMIALLMVLRAKGTAVVSTAVTLLILTVYKLYRHFAFGADIEGTAYLWPPIILLALLGMYLFISLYSTIEGINGVLNQRIDELTMIDPLTGIENLRSMLGSLGRYMALSERNGTAMGLMLLRLRYADEIKKVLSKRQFNDLRHMIAITVQDALRLEDRVFSIDNDGSLGIIYFSEEKGAAIVKGRLKNAVSGKDMLPDLNEQMLTVELSIVYRHYEKSFGKDALRYYNEVEKEFAYEV